MARKKRKRDNYSKQVQKNSRRKERKTLQKRKKEAFIQMKKAEQFELKNVIRYKDDFRALIDTQELQEITFNSAVIEKSASIIAQEFQQEFEGKETVEARAETVLRYRIRLVNLVVNPGLKKKIMKKVEMAAKRTYQDGNEELAETFSNVFGYVQKRTVSPGENLFIRMLYENRTGFQYPYPDNFKESLTAIDTHLDKLAEKWIEDARKKEEEKQEKDLAKVAVEETTGEDKNEVEDAADVKPEEVVRAEEAEEKEGTHVPEEVAEEVAEKAQPVTETTEETPETVITEEPAQEPTEPVTEEKIEPPAETVTEAAEEAVKPEPKKKKSFFSKLFGKKE